MTEARKFSDCSCVWMTGYLLDSSYKICRRQQIINFIDKQYLGNPVSQDQYIFSTNARHVSNIALIF